MGEGDGDVGEDDGGVGEDGGDDDGPARIGRPIQSSVGCKKYENLYDAVYRPENLAILQYCYENNEYNSDIDAFIEKVSAVPEETNILQESMEEEVDETVS